MAMPPRIAAAFLDGPLSAAFLILNVPLQALTIEEQRKTGARTVPSCAS
jgi:hypothetical protein